MPAFIFCARICDVSLGTLRIAFVSREMRLRAAALGFVEVLIWIIVVAQLIGHLDNWINFVAYAAGFSAGTYLGLWIENKLKVGTFIVRIISAGNIQELIERLREADFMLTQVSAQGSLGPVEIVFTIAKRKRWPELKAIIDSYNADVFYSLEEVKFASGATEDKMVISNVNHVFDRLLRTRKGV
jgi:uncharacterized protein YebE (UPF0316 family)